MKILTLLLALAFIACDEQPTDWQQTLAIQTDGRTSYRVVIIADVAEDAPVVEIPDYATEVLIIKDGGFVRVHSTPDNRDYVSRGDTLRIPVR